jgi:hypothetical protein
MSDKITYTLIITITFFTLSAGQIYVYPKPPDPVYPVGIVGGPYYGPNNPSLDSLFKSYDNIIRPLPINTDTIGTSWRDTPITAGLLEEFLADTSTMDSVYIDWGAAMRDKSGELKWGPRWISPPYPKTLPGLLAWIKHKEK